MESGWFEDVSPQGKPAEENEQTTQWKHAPLIQWTSVENNPNIAMENNWKNFNFIIPYKYIRGPFYSQYWIII